MVLRSTHRYIAEASDRQGRRLGELALSPDFAPAAEWSHLEGMRRGTIPAAPHHGPGAVEPVFEEASGGPYLAGIRVRFDAADPAGETPLVPWSYFQQSVEASATAQVRAGRTELGEPFVYRIYALRTPGAGASGTGGPRELAPAVSPAGAPAPVPATLVLGNAALAPRRARARRANPPTWNDGDLPVFVQTSVLDESVALARAAGDHETGGVLVGHLHRDTASTELHAEITAQIPAAGAHAGRTHLEFTAETWAAVSAALALRRRDEIWLGWWHFHPYFCRRCEPAQRRRCALSEPFFSQDDRELHRIVFDSAFSVALLLTDVGEAELRRDWFGWRAGAIAPRGCYELAHED